LPNSRSSLGRIRS